MTAQLARSHHELLESLAAAKILPDSDSLRRLSEIEQLLAAASKAEALVGPMKLSLGVD